MKLLKNLFQKLTIDTEKLGISATDVAALALKPHELQRTVAMGMAGEKYFIADRGLLRLEEGAVEQLCDWFEIQQAIWAGESKRLVIRWVDPQRTPLTLHLHEHEQTAFMRLFDEKVAQTIVLTMRRKAENGTNLIATVRRRADGELFSALVADGTLDAAGEKLAFELEKNLRDAVGLAD